MKTIIKIALIYAVSAVSLFAKYTVTSTYQRNKKLWGTYKQLNEQNSRFKTAHFQSGDAIIGRKGLTIIKSLEQDLDSKIIVVTLPYKRIAKRKYQISFEGNEKKLQEIYGESLKGLGLNPDYTSFDNFTCKTYRSGKLNCQIELLPMPTVASQN